ncbi:cytochrome P450, partial [Trametes coccinea BRFM310]
MRDPAAYDEPEQFNPDRFIRDGKLDTSVRDPAVYVFGYGRSHRVCPGRYFAEDMLYIVVACVLHVFNIEPPLDEHGQPIRSEYHQTHGLISHPQDFGCVFKPRYSDASTASLISGVEGAVSL